jgi:excisionase family DNA binding protein
MSKRKGKEYDGVGDIAEKLGVSDKTVRKLIKRAKLPAARIGGRLKIPKAAYAEWEKERRVTA